jgi:hypothetical protein
MSSRLGHIKATFMHVNLKLLGKELSRDVQG